MWPFSDFQYGFRSSQSTADLLTVVSDRTARAFIRSWTTRAVALDISKAFDRVWHAGLLDKINSYGISGQIFGLRPRKECLFSLKQVVKKNCVFAIFRWGTHLYMSLFLSICPSVHPSVHLSRTISQELCII